MMIYNTYKYVFAMIICNFLKTSKEYSLSFLGPNLQQRQRAKNPIKINIVIISLFTTF